MNSITHHTSQKEFAYGYLCGQLETIARFNDKCDNGFTFDLSRFSKKGSVKQSIEPSFINFCDDYKLLEVENPILILSQELLNKWFFEYLNADEYHLKDEGNNFSLTFDPWKKEWTNDFVNYLFKTIEPVKVYTVQMINLNCHYASRWEHYVFETDSNDDWHYILQLSVSD